MTSFRIATFNAQNLIGPDQEYQRFEQYSPEDYAAKRDWMAGQLNRMKPDIVGFQEIIDPEPLREVIAGADALAPGRPPYAGADLAFAPNFADSGPGERRPGLAVLSRLGFEGDPQSIQLLDPPLDIPFHHLGGGDAGHYQLTRLTRPILKVRVPVGGHVLTVFNVHLKSRMGEFVRPKGARFSPEIDLLQYDAAGRALGLLRASLRRMAEAWVLRKLVVDELEAGNPVAVLGDLNATPQSATQQIIAGEAPFPDHTWLRRHDARSADDTYTRSEDATIREAVERVRLHSAERLFIRKSLRDLAYTNAFGGVFESFDAILFSRHFHPDWPGRIGEMTHFGVYNDHITDGTHPEAPGNVRASDHGQIMAHVRLV
ncbi:endonuclease/exonuclease/phosphatase family protein [Rhodovulum euryhalinum]|uniref:Endonuclease/exonuclease/phosphatase family metal-dependent hydrolase n=1 Tax=Rhodovulum euryhalinum TaxID=35805 RepID=A0A4R2L1B7_9RHOB|nr:endonuclease/exonuclease/phosphatase family protein [Rhodovulum euryhalinum]TCO72805.1 endonuclease/exonuclease/phosphatase family metal-dependent hydrolase [Rhodovulum euryhalinum]